MTRSPPQDFAKSGWNAHRLGGSTWPKAPKARKKLSLFLPASDGLRYRNKRLLNNKNIQKLFIDIYRPFSFDPSCTLSEGLEGKDSIHCWLRLMIGVKRLHDLNLGGDFLLCWTVSLRFPFLHLFTAWAYTPLKLLEYCQAWSSQFTSDLFQWRNGMLIDTMGHSPGCLMISPHISWIMVPRWPPLPLRCKVCSRVSSGTFSWGSGRFSSIFPGRTHENPRWKMVESQLRIIRDSGKSWNHGTWWQMNANDGNQLSLLLKRPP